MSEINNLNLLGTTYDIVDDSAIHKRADWSETDTSSDAYIAHKPENLVQDANYVHTDNNFTTAEKTKLADLENGKSKTLTSADYNYPVENPNGVAMWKVPSGIYTNTNGTKIYLSTGSSSSSPISMVVAHQDNGNTSIMYSETRGMSNNYPLAGKLVNNSGQEVQELKPIGIDKIANNLVTTSYGQVLDARQGKVLKDLIDAIHIPTKTSELTNDSDFQTSTQVNNAVATEATARSTADTNLQTQIDAIVASSDVKDIVGTKAELNNYDTTTLGDRDIIKVLNDESQNNETTYYRWSTSTSTFTLIGEEGPYYTKSATDTLLNTKADKVTTYTKTETDTLLATKQGSLTAGSNITISNNTISATDTTYTAGAGLNLAGTEFTVDTTTIATQSDLTNGLATKQNTLTVGNNIQINNNTISATDTTYTAGYGLELNGTEFSVDTDIVQDTLTAGDNITIEDESGSLVISATDTTYSAGTGLDLTGTEFSVDFDNVQGKLTAGDNITIEEESGALVISADGGLDPATTFWGQTANNGVVTGTLTVPGNRISFLPSVSIQSGGITLGDSMPFYFKTSPSSGSSFNVLSWNSAHNQIPEHVKLAAYQSSMTLSPQNLILAGSGSSGVKISGVQDGTANTDAINKGQLDSAVNGIESELDGKQDVLTAGQGISITDESGDLVISATSTGPNVVQTTGTSTTDVMSQNATTSMVYADPEAKTKIRIGGGTVGSATDPVVIGRAASVRGDYAVAIGSAAGSQVTNAPGGISLGAFSEAGGRGQMDISLATATQQAQANYGYNGSAYRLLTGLYDPQSDHDAATKGYVDNSLLGKQDALTAGSGISIADESGSLVISTTVAEPDEFTSNEWNALWS